MKQRICLLDPLSCFHLLSLLPNVNYRPFTLCNFFVDRYANVCVGEYLLENLL